MSNPRKVLPPPLIQGLLRCGQLIDKTPATRLFKTSQKKKLLHIAPSIVYIDHACVQFVRLNAINLSHSVTNKEELFFLKRKPEKGSFKSVCNLFCVFYTFGRTNDLTTNIQKKKRWNEFSTQKKTTMMLLKIWLLWTTRVTNLCTHFVPFRALLIIILACH